MISVNLNEGFNNYGVSVLTLRFQRKSMKYTHLSQLDGCLVEEKERVALSREKVTIVDSGIIREKCAINDEGTIKEREQTKYFIIKG